MTYYTYIIYFFNEIFGDTLYTMPFFDILYIYNIVVIYYMTFYEFFKT